MLSASANFIFFFIYYYNVKQLNTTVFWISTDAGRLKRLYPFI